VSDLDAIAADIRWIRRNMEAHDNSLVEIFGRLSKIEADLAGIQAGQKPPVSGWAIIGVIATIAVSVLVILDRIYVNQ